MTKMTLPVHKAFTQPVRAALKSASLDGFVRVVPRETVNAFGGAVWAPVMPKTGWPLRFNGLQEVIAVARAAAEAAGALPDRI